MFLLISILQRSIKYTVIKYLIKNTSTGKKKEIHTDPLLDCLLDGMPVDGLALIKHCIMLLKIEDKCCIVQLQNCN